MKIVKFLTAVTCCLGIGLLAGIAGIGGSTAAAAQGAEEPPAGDETTANKPKTTPRLVAEKYSGNLKITSRGVRKVKMTFQFAAKRNADIEVRAIHRDKGIVVKRWLFPAAKPELNYSVNWTGSREGGGVPPTGDYVLRIREIGVGGLRRGNLPASKRIQLKHYLFPIANPGKRVYFGDGWGAGRGHRGADAFAPCGRKMYSARAGKVVFKGHQRGGAGRYVVIRGTGDGRDLVYMHMQKGIKVDEGDKVKTGQAIGKVGATGNASGCHLHFEVWRGHWYAGGKARPEALKLLKRWHRWT